MLFGSDLEMEAFAKAFEDRSLEAVSFSHQGHVALAAVYVLRHGAAAALERLRREIPLFNVAKGGINNQERGYHETLTVFWVLLIEETLREMTGLTDLEKVNSTIERLSTSGLWREYYSFDVLKNPECRFRWVAPDVRSLGVPVSNARVGGFVEGHR